MTSCEGYRRRARIRVSARSILGHEAFGQQATKVDLDWAEQGELEVEESDDLTVPQGVHQREVAVIDDLLDDWRGSVVAVDDLVQPRPLHLGQANRETDANGRRRGGVECRRYESPMRSDERTKRGRRVVHNL